VTASGSEVRVLVQPASAELGIGVLARQDTAFTTGDRPCLDPNPYAGPALRSAARAAKECPQRLLGVVDQEERHPTWRLSLLDMEHSDGWSWEITPPVEMEQLTWREVRAQQTGGNWRRGAKHKYIPVNNLCPIARERIIALKLDDFDELFRFRLGNLERLWGVVRDGVFYPIWWDPEHRVCTSADR
jgi:hypothetical protein